MSNCGEKYSLGVLIVELTVKGCCKNRVLILKSQSGLETKQPNGSKWILEGCQYHYPRHLRTPQQHPSDYGTQVIPLSPLPWPDPPLSYPFGLCAEGTYY